MSYSYGRGRRTYSRSPFATDDDSQDQASQRGRSSTRIPAPPSPASSSSHTSPTGGNRYLAPTDRPTSPLTYGSRTRAGAYQSSAMSSILGGSAPTPVVAPAAERSRSRSRGFAAAESSESPFATSTTEPVPPIRTDMRSPVPRSENLRSPGGARSAVPGYMRSVSPAPSVAASDMTVSAFRDPEAFRKFKTKLADLKEDLGNAKSELDKRTRERDELQNKVASLEQESTAAHRDLSQAHAQIRDLDEELATQKAEMQAEISALRNELGQTQNDLAAKTAAHDDLAYELRTLRVDHANLAKASDEDREELRVLQEQLEIAQRALQEKTQEFDSLRKEKDRRSLEFQQADKKRIDLEESFKELSGHSKAIESSHEQAQDELTYLASQLQEEREARLAAEAAAQDALQRLAELEEMMS
ncbi:hypothetical protein AMAG_12887 [Allomyces macrogynus ATCC 38327]|uniref:Uncharacterized protein n=1 Tax=Allomyces macrogynus (strain ATCC 38327) TaxID=578462 RepID=A0A0L0T094_ALLM3|nr:hypothetical protein AMAG_12887 [Allomyces macrogynus ATCC 38327]|eukprot:KNE68208.1 hypothetical protein AMAG_12887 [Allomyces macrogynus ATCC 38327]